MSIIHITREEEYTMNTCVQLKHIQPSYVPFDSRDLVLWQWYTSFSFVHSFPCTTYHDDEYATETFLSEVTPNIKTSI